MITTSDGKTQVQRKEGEPTGFTDMNGQMILVGDHMSVRHFCNCPFCEKYYVCNVTWSDGWQAYGLVDKYGVWHSGMGIASGIMIADSNGYPIYRSDT